jgi:hypothetical protein
MELRFRIAIAAGMVCMVLAGQSGAADWYNSLSIARETTCGVGVPPARYSLYRNTAITEVIVPASHRASNAEGGVPFSKIPDCCGPSIFSCRPEPRLCLPEPVCAPQLCHPDPRYCQRDCVCAPVLCRPEPERCQPEPICADPEPRCRANCPTVCCPILKTNTLPHTLNHTTAKRK